MFPYAEKLREFIPSNVLALSISCEGAINMANDSPNFQLGISWGVFGIFLIGLPFYMWFVRNEHSVTPLVFAVIAFIILELAMGGPFVRTWSESASIIQATGGVLALIFAAFVVPIIAGIKGD